MKRQTLITKTIALLLSVSIIVSGCASSTLIQTSPTKAKIYIDGEPVGTTPYTHIDTKIMGSSTIVKLEKEGYEPLNTYFSRTEVVDVGAIIGGFFCWVPFLWTMKYKPVHYYEMVPLSGSTKSVPERNNTDLEKLREYKKMLDDGLISTEDYESAKAKIIGE